MCSTFCVQGIDIGPVLNVPKNLGAFATIILSLPLRQTDHPQPPLCNNQVCHPAIWFPYFYSCLKSPFTVYVTFFGKILQILWNYFSSIFDANKRHMSLHQDIHRLSCLYCYTLCQYAPAFTLFFNYYVRYLFFFWTTLFPYIEYDSKNNQYNTDTYNNDYHAIMLFIL